MRNKVWLSIMNNKVLMSVLAVLLLVAGGLPFWLDVGDYQGNNNFVYIMLFFSLLGGFWILAFSYFINELKKISNTIWRPVGVLVLAIGLFLHYNCGGLFSMSEFGVVSLFRQPIMWLLIGTAISYLIVFFYNRSNQLSS